MSRAFLAETLIQSLGDDITTVQARNAAADLVDAIILELKQKGMFTVPGFGRFAVRRTKRRKAMNPSTGETVQVPAGKTVRFKASKVLKQNV